MKSLKLATAYLVFSISAVGLSQTANAERQIGFPFADELDSCVTAVYEHLDLTDVNRVRHTVVKEKRTGIGYALSIETTVFSDAAERRYRAYCVAAGTRAPSKFRIDERTD